MLIAARYISFYFNLLIFTSHSSLAAVYCMADPNGPPIQAEDCRHLVARIPSLYFDPNVQLHRGELSHSLRLPAEGYRSPAFFMYNTCAVKITVLPTYPMGVITEQHLAMFIWRAARSAAREIVRKCMAPHSYLGWNWGHSEVPGIGQVSFNVWLIPRDAVLQRGCTIYNLVGKEEIRDAGEPRSDAG